MADTTLATNRAAFRDYHILETLEAGLVLTGTEIKSLRQHRVSLADSFARIDGSEVFLYNMHVEPYEQGNRENVEPKRPRKLLLHRRQIEQLIGQTIQRGLVVVPLKLYVKHGFAKVELAVAKGKRQYDKRETLRRRETQREIDRTLKARKRR